MKEPWFEVNWELARQDPQDQLNAMFYLLQILEFRIDKNRYDLLSDEGKKYFKLAEEGTTKIL